MTNSVEIANRAVAANLKADGSPKYESAQGFSCAMEAVLLTKAALAPLLPRMKVNKPDAAPTPAPADLEDSCYIGPTVTKYSGEETAIDISVGLAQHIAGFLGPEFSSLPRNKAQLREWQRSGGAGQTDYTQEDLLEIAEASIAYVAHHSPRSVIHPSIKQAWDLMSPGKATSKGGVSGPITEKQATTKQGDKA